MSIPKLDQVLKLEQIKWAIKQGKLRPKDENIDNHGYIDTSILWIYRRYISGYFGKKYR